MTYRKYRALRGQKFFSQVGFSFAGLDEGYYERSEEFTDIDERLNRLQDLMKKSDLV